MIFIKFYPDSFKLLINNFLGKGLTHIKPHGGGTFVQFSIQNILKYTLPYTALTDQNRLTKKTVQKSLLYYN